MKVSSEDMLTQNRRGNQTLVLLVHAMQRAQGRQVAAQVTA